MSQAGEYTSPWIQSVRQTLDECGLSYIWLEQQCDNIKWLKMKVEQSLKDQFLQRWHTELQSMTSCDFYCTIKENLNLEKYLLCENVKHRQALCNLRLANNRIPKTVGRYKGIDRNERYCNMCTGELLGDEYHVLFECQNEIIVENRKRFLPKYYTKHPSMAKCICLFQSNEKKLLYKLGAFLSNILPLFK